MDSIGVTTGPVSGFISEVHGGKIMDVNDGKALTTKQIQTGLILQTIARVKAQCFDKLTSSDQKMITKTIEEAKQAIQKK
jgi:hypothetical protein